MRALRPARASRRPSLHPELDGYPPAAEGPRRIGSELADPPHPSKRSDSLREAGAGSCSATTGPQGRPTWRIAFTTHGAIA